MKKIILSLVLVTILSSLAFGTLTQPAYATGNTIADKLSCQTLGGVWTDSSSTCSISNLTINPTDILKVNSNIVLKLDGNINNLGFLVSNAGSTILNIGNMTNSGTIDNYGTTVNSGTISNSGTFYNYGTLSGTGTFTSTLISISNTGTITDPVTIPTTTISSSMASPWDISFPITIPSGVILTVNSGQTLLSGNNLTNFGTITNSGTITNYAAISNGGIITNSGTITNANYGTITNSGTIANSGTITSNTLINNNSGGTITINYGGSLQSGGTITNSATVTINSKGHISNTGTITNSATVTINSGGIMNNTKLDNPDSGIFSNTGTITNIGAFSNTGTITNSGTIANSGTFYNYGTIPNGGIITNSGTITNSIGTNGKITNNCGSTFTNSASLIGNSPVPECSTTTNITPNPASETSLSTITFTAIVNVGTSTHFSPSGTIQWGDNGSGKFNPSSCILSSSDSCSTTYTPSGISNNPKITAAYSGDTTYSPSSGQTSLSINVSDSTTTIVTPNPARTNQGTQIAFTATVVDTSNLPIIPTGSISWSDNGAGGAFGQPICTTQNSNTSICNTQYAAISKAGTVIITANFGGDNFHQSSSGASTLTVMMPSPSTTVPVQNATTSSTNNTVSVPTISNTGITVSTDKLSYNLGDTIIISSKLSSNVPNQAITIRVLNELQNPIDIAILTPTPDGSATTKLLATGPLWQTSGTYTIMAQYNSTVKTLTAFYFNSGNGTSYANNVTSTQSTTIMPQQPSQTTQLSTSQPTTIITPTPQDIQSINQAKTNQTIAAEVNVGVNQAQTTSIDNTVSVQTTSSTPDSLNVNVSAPSQTAPKIIMFNLPATTNVANLQDLGVMYDGKPIQPAPSIDTLLHAKPTDNPSFAIVVTQSGVQVLVLVPHFSTHTITITNMSKVITSTVPEFGSLAGMIIIVSVIGVIVVSRRFRIVFS